jgi:integrase
MKQTRGFATELAFEANGRSPGRGPVHQGPPVGPGVKVDGPEINLAVDVLAGGAPWRLLNGRPGGVPIDRAVYDALISLEPEAARRAGGCSWQRRAGRRGGQIRVAFEKALERAKIAGFRFHDLCHTAASHLVMRGSVPQQGVKEILGLTTIAMTLRYAHLSPAHLRTAVDRLEGLGEGIRSGSQAGMERTSAVL